jgi:hypothetical protein
VGKKKSKTDESIPKWLTGLGSETLEQRLAFRNWIQWSGGRSLDDEYKEIIMRGWLPIIRGEYKKSH